MKYKTIIEIINEADDSNEAADIAGEYLRGNLSSGIKMKCSTKKVNKFLTLKITSCIVFIVFCSIVFITNKNLNKNSNSFTTYLVTSNDAIQPPLKTTESDKQFNKTWQKIAELLKSYSEEK